MADERDYRLRIDLCFPPEVKQYAEQIRNVLVQLYTHAVTINEGLGNQEIGFISLERDGHRLGLSCNEIARWEVGKGKVI
jgi:hypothetical protein